MHEFLSEEVAMACYSAGLLNDPAGKGTAAFMETVELAGPVLHGRDHTDPALVTEVRLAAGDLLGKLSDNDIAQLIPILRREYEKQRSPLDD
jgi:hypothetical protein